MTRTSKGSSKSKSSRTRSGSERGKGSGKSGSSAGSREQQSDHRTSGNAEVPRPQGMGGNQGEGNREADRRYREGATQFERSGRVPRAAEEARREIEDETGASGRGEQDLDFDHAAGYDEERDLEQEARDRSRLS
jgi:hypothetical protein